MRRWLTAILTAALLIGAYSCSRDPNVAKRKYVETGNKYFQRGKYKEAAIMYRSALKRDMKYGEAYYRLGLCQLKLNQPAQAARALRRAVELEDKNDDAKAKLADLYLAAYMANPQRPKELYEEIKELATALVKRDPTSFDGLRLLGYLAWRDRNLKEAIEKFQAADRAKQFDQDVILALSQVLAEANRHEEGEQLAKRLIEKKKDFAPIYDALYLQYARQNRLADADAIRRLKVENNPKESVYIRQLAQHYYLTNRKSEAAEVMNQMLASPKDFPWRFKELGEFYAQFREFDKAISYFQEGLRSGNRDERLVYHRRIADLMIAQGKKRQAAAYVDDTLKEYPKDAGLQALRATLLLDIGGREQVQTAISDLQASVGQMPQNPVLRFNLGRAHWAKGEIDQAKTQFTQAVTLRPDYLAPRLALSQIALNRGEWGAALQGANEVLTLSPDNLQAHLLRGSALMGMGKHDQARTELTALVKSNPSSKEALFHLGRMALSLKEYEEAEQTFQKCIDDSPAGMRCTLGLVESYAARKQFDKAFQVMSAAEQKSPQEQSLKLGMANLAVQAGKHDVAVAIYQELLKRDPKSSDLVIRLGETYRRMGNTSEAIAYFRRAKELAPNDPATHFPLALVLDATGQHQESMKIYEQVLKLQPDNPVALNNLAYLMAELGGDLDLALTYAQRAKQKYPQSPDVSDTLGWLYIKKNLSAEAIGIYKDLIAQQPTNATFRYHLGMALFQKGDKPQAKRELQAALKGSPSKEEEGKIRELLARIG